jgi:hypothetical protein
LVIAAAGGVVLRVENREALRASGAKVVWLSADVDTLVVRVRNGEHRPALDGDPAGTLRRMHETREPLYREVADVIVSVDGRSVADVARKYLLIDMKYLGAVPYDEAVPAALVPRPSVAVTATLHTSPRVVALAGSVAEVLAGTQGTTPHVELALSVPRSAGAEGAAPTGSTRERRPPAVPTEVRLPPHEDDALALEQGQAAGVHALRDLVVFDAGFHVSGLLRLD